MLARHGSGGGAGRRPLIRYAAAGGNRPSVSERSLLLEAVSTAPDLSCHPGGRAPGKSSGGAFSARPGEAPGQGAPGKSSGAVASPVGLSPMGEVPQRGGRGFSETGRSPWARSARKKLRCGCLPCWAQPNGAEVPGKGHGAAFSAKSGEAQGHRSLPSCARRRNSWRNLFMPSGNSCAAGATSPFPTRLVRVIIYLCEYVLGGNVYEKGFYGPAGACVCFDIVADRNGTCCGR